MESNEVTPDAYVASLPEERRPSINKLREVINRSLPNGFSEAMGYGMLAYIVPKSIYPLGYHVDPNLPLPFINVASQKNFIAIYHMGLYADHTLLEWFKKEYAKQVPTKLDMGKSCIRFKNLKHIPYDLIGDLVSKISVKEWISLYEKSVVR